MCGEVTCEVDHQKVLVGSKLNGIDRIHITELVLFQSNLVFLLVSQVTHIIVEHFLQKISVEKQNSDVITVNSK